MMTQNQFEQKVYEMRRLQKDYFRTRDILILRAAKKAEKEIDDYLHEMESNHPVKSKEKDEHPKLF